MIKLKIIFNFKKIQENVLMRFLIKIFSKLDHRQCLLKHKSCVLYYQALKYKNDVV